MPSVGKYLILFYINASVREETSVNWEIGKME